MVFLTRSSCIPYEIVCPSWEKPAFATLVGMDERKASKSFFTKKSACKCYWGFWNLCAAREILPQEQKHSFSRPQPEHTPSRLYPCRRGRDEGAPQDVLLMSNLGMDRSRLVGAAAGFLLVTIACAVAVWHVQVRILFSFLKNPLLDCKVFVCSWFCCFCAQERNAGNAASYTPTRFGTGPSELASDKAFEAEISKIIAPVKVGKARYWPSHHGVLYFFIF